MKTSRRQFLTATSTALAALPAALHAADPRPAPTGLIDCQSHLFSPDMLTMMDQSATDPVVFTKDGTRYLRMGEWLRKVPPLYLDVDAKLATMNAAGIAMTVLSINDPGPEWFGADGPAVAQMANDFVADVVRKHPTRFFGLCVLPWQDVPASLKELARCAARPAPARQTARRAQDRPVRARRRALCRVRHQALPSARVHRRVQLRRLAQFQEFFTGTDGVVLCAVELVGNRQPSRRADPLAPESQSRRGRNAEGQLRTAISPRAARHTRHALQTLRHSRHHRSERADWRSEIPTHRHREANRRRAAESEETHLHHAPR